MTTSPNIVAKIAGVALVTKLRLILLFEEDYNYHSRLIFGKRMMDLAQECGVVPDEIYSQKGRTAEDAVLHQILTYDIARQTKAPMLVASVDAAQCYDRIAHSIAGLACQASGVPTSSVRSMLKLMREMEFLSGLRSASQKIMLGEKKISSKAVDKATERRHRLGSRLVPL